MERDRPMFTFGWLRYSTSDCGPLNEGLRFATCAHEPMARFLVGRLRLTPLGMVSLGVVVVGFVHLGSLLAYLLFKPAKVDAFLGYQFGEWSVAAVFWIALPLLIGFYPWIIRKSGSLYEELRQEQVLPDSETAKQLVLTGARSIDWATGHRAWSYGAAVVALLAQVVIFTQGFSKVWPATPEIGIDIWIFYVIATPANMLGFYLIAIIVGRYIATVRGLSWVFSAKEADNRSLVNLHPWHPDHTGGLGIVSDYAIRMSWFIAAAGLMMLLFAYISVVVRFEEANQSEWASFWASPARDPGLLIGLTIYLALSPAIFFLTLGAAHRAMLRAKQERLSFLSRQLDSEDKKVTEDLPSGEADLGMTVARIKGLNELYELTRAFPVWPFDITTLRRFLTAVLAPIVTVAASAGLQQLLSP